MPQLGGEKRMRLWHTVSNRGVGGGGLNQEVPDKKELLNLLQGDSLMEDIHHWKSFVPEVASSPIWKRD